MLFKTIKYFYFLDSTTFRGLGKNIFWGFLGYEKTRLFALEIYRHLEGTFSLQNVSVETNLIYFFNLGQYLQVQIHGWCQTNIRRKENDVCRFRWQFSLLLWRQLSTQRCILTRSSPVHILPHKVGDSNQGFQRPGPNKWQTFLCVPPFTAAVNNLLCMKNGGWGVAQ